MRSIFTLLTIAFLHLGVGAQNSDPSDLDVWHDPLDYTQRLDGQGWERIGYHRLPPKAENLVRSPVWNLSKNSAGLAIAFTSNSKKISIQYQVSGGMGMNHMPPTGVSGVDLYLKSGSDWRWCRGKYSFKGVMVNYVFTLDHPKQGISEFKLFLPLYNTVQGLKIGVTKASEITFGSPGPQKPIVVYGTSIAQGACASRPGMAWTNILVRALNRPVVNLGFSGNGRLEPELIELIGEIEASVYVLDCLPNLSPNEKRTKEEIQGRIKKSVLRLREKRPETPILLVHHAGYSDGAVNTQRKTVYETLNNWMSESYNTLISEGVEQLFLLSKEDIGLTNDAFVDGTHPTDLGMQQYAEAYKKVLINISKDKP